MYAVIRKNRDRSITLLQSCRTLDALIVASQREKSKVPLAERANIRVAVMKDGGYTEIRL